ncbi:MAG: L,D-transpeptidase [bacterium]
MDKTIFLIFLVILAILLFPLGGSVEVFSSDAPQNLSCDFLSPLISSLDLAKELGSQYFNKISDNLKELKSILLINQKKIVVSLSQQTLYLMEGDKIVALFPTLTGARGMGTPPGHYTVLSKYRSVTMEGQIGTPLEYRVENVPWVLFFIDRTYAIHGNYWKPLNFFGKDPSFTGSHGCVGLTPEDAKKVYDWAEVGTEIIIQE